MSFTHGDLARVRRRRRGSSAPRELVDRSAERALNARLDLARMLYGGHVG